MLKKMLRQSQQERQMQRNQALEQKLLRHEAKIGGRLFGDVPAGGRREFFCLDEHTWVWHEEWTDRQTGERKVQATRYEVRPDRILRVRDGHYQPVSRKEADHLLQAARAYRDAVGQKLYSRV